MPDVDVLVVGAGLAGLTAALELQRQGRSVRVLEAAPRVGGCIASVRTPSGELPRGPTTFSGRHQVLWNLIDAVGLSAEVKPVSQLAKRRFVVRDGGLRALTPSPLSLLTTRALTFANRRSLWRERSVPRGSGDDESLDSFFRRRFGDDVTDALADAMISGIWAGRLTELGLHACLPQLAEYEQQHGSVIRGAMKSSKGGTGKRGIFRIEGGLGRIAERAKEQLDVVTGNPVERLSRSGSRWSVDSTQAAQLLLAVPANVAATLLSSHAPAAAEHLRACRYAPMTLVHWASETSKLPTGIGYLSPEREGLFAMGTLFQSDIEADASSKTMQGSLRWFTSFVGGMRHSERAELPDDALQAGVADDVRRLTGGTVERVLHVERWPRAVFQPPVGHAKQLAALEQHLHGANLFLAGSYLGAGAMADAIHSGLTAAHRLMSASSTHRPVESAASA